MYSLTCGSIATLIGKESFCYSYLYFFIFESNNFSISFYDSKFAGRSQIYIFLYFWRRCLYFFFCYFVLLHFLFPKNPLQNLFIFIRVRQEFLCFLYALFRFSLAFVHIIKLWIRNQPQKHNIL